MRQPLLHDAEVALDAPAQLWSRAGGDLVSPIDGLYVSDVRVLRRLVVEVAGSPLEHIATDRHSGAATVLIGLLRGLDGRGADPRIRLERERTVGPSGMTERLTVVSGRAVAVEVDLTIRLTADLTPMQTVKTGIHGPALGVVPAPDGAAWGDAEVGAELAAPGFDVECSGAEIALRWRTRVPAHGTASTHWSVVVRDAAAVVVPPSARITLAAPPTGHPDLDEWTRRALDDIERLQLALPAAPEDVFVAAGAPWFMTLFGRDAIWAARMLLPLDARLALGTLRVLARLQGRRTDERTAERPGAILHELRRGENALGGGAVLPPRYYGTIDATPLWILLLHDAWRAGLADHDVAELLPNLRAALGWLRDAVSADGFLTYHDPTGHGLTNQGWKDSGDSVQWRDGRLAQGPIALCEVQAYAHEAALAAAALLATFGEAAEAHAWLAWASALKARFRTAFWVDGADGGYPAIALDAEGRAVDSLTSNIGHLLGTGILDADDEARVAALLMDTRLDSGSGLRTLSTDGGGYWPLSYHGGSVWAHDTAIAVHGLLRSGFSAEARVLAEGLLRAARRFDWRMPELYSGDTGAPVPYPAACRPQAWSATAAVVVRAALAPDHARRGRTPVITEPVHAADRP